MPIIIWSPQDLSRTWKCLNTGSGAGKHGDPIGVTCAHAQGIRLDFRCEHCQVKNRGKCYHWTVGDEDSVQFFQKILSDKMQQYMQDCGRSFQEV